MPYNRPAAIDSMGTIAAPLLASVSIALIAVILSDVESYHLLTLALLALLVAAAGFVATVEFSFLARQYAITPGELEGWWPNPDQAGRRELLRREQRFHVLRFESWADRARWAYNIAILALTVGVTAILVPNGHVSVGRVLAIVVAGLASVAEMTWIVKTTFTRQRPELPDVGPETSL
jgi:hypothetical protein